MIVADLFQSVNFDDLWKETSKKFNFKSEKEKRQSRACHKAAWDIIMDIKPERSNEFIIVFYYMYEADIETGESIMIPTSDLYEKKEIRDIIKNKPSFPMPEFTNIEKMELKELNTHIKKSILPVSYAYDLLKWKETLGFALDPISMKQVGKTVALSLIFFEMTFMGFEEDTIQETLEELNNRHQHVLEDIERIAKNEEPIYIVAEGWHELDMTNIDIPEYTEEEQKRDRINDLKTQVNKYKALYNATL